MEYNSNLPIEGSSNIKNNLFLRFQFFLTACKAIGRARNESDTKLDYMNKMLLHALQVCQDVDTSTLSEAGYEGEEFGAKVKELRMQALDRTFN